MCSLNNYKLVLKKLCNALDVNKKVSKTILLFAFFSDLLDSALETFFFHFFSNQSQKPVVILASYHIFQHI